LSLAKDEVFIKSIVNTFLFVLYIVPATVVFSLLFAVLIIEKSPKVQTFFRAAFYLPVVISIVSVSLVWNNLYNPAYGVLNYLISLFGVQPISWLGDKNLVIPALSLVVLTYTMGQPIILNLAALGGIPITYYEASDIDGANSWSKFWHITLPLLKPTTLYIFVTTTISAFQVFAIINLMTSGGPNYASSTVLYLIYRMAFYYNDLGVASTMGVILFVFVALFSIVQFKLFSESVEY
jgi:multiple sugar transport system permease protein